MNDREFVTAAENCAIPCREFRHADHVRLVWLYLREYALLDAIGRFTAALRRFATHCGAAGKYHETITWAYLLIIHERMQRDECGNDWERFRAANSDLFAWSPSILEHYYAPQTLASDLARRIFVLPDRGVLQRGTGEAR
jgi:hypothetical protein